MNSCFFCRNAKRNSINAECSFRLGKGLQVRHLIKRENKDRDDSEIFQDVAAECVRFRLNREQVLRGWNCKKLTEKFEEEKQK